MAEHIRTELVLDALGMAIVRRKLDDGGTHRPQPSLLGRVKYRMGSAGYPTSAFFVEVAAARP
jgi:hypothetical protein